jgi:transcriptional regulator with XRE-family HTH domain
LVGQLIEESGQTYTWIAARMRHFLGVDSGVQRQTVARWEREPVVRMPSVEYMRALAWSLGVSPRLVLHLFIASHEAHYLELMGLPEELRRPRESFAHALADRLDSLADPEERRRMTWAWRSLLEASESRRGEEPAVTDAEQLSTGDRFRRMGDRIIVDIGGEDAEDDAKAVIELLERRRRERDGKTARDPS